MKDKAWVKVEILATRQALSRKVINRHLVRIRSVFGWAVEEELIPGTVAYALGKVKGLPPGERGVKESKPVAPAFWERVQGHRTRGWLEVGLGRERPCAVEYTLRADC